MATAKTIEQLNAATQINATDQMALAQESGKEAVRGSVQMLAGAVAEINQTGALSELAYATSQGKNLLAQNLTAKGVPTQASETLIQMADKVNLLNIDASAEDIIMPLAQKYAESTSVYGAHCQATSSGDVFLLSSDGNLYVFSGTATEADISGLTDFMATAKASITPQRTVNPYYCKICVNNEGSVIVLYDTNSKYIQKFSYQAQSNTFNFLKEFYVSSSLNQSYPWTITDDGKFIIWQSSANSVTVCDTEGESFSSLNVNLVYGTTKMAEEIYVKEGILYAYNAGYGCAKFNITQGQDESVSFVYLTSCLFDFEAAILDKKAMCLIGASYGSSATPSDKTGFCQVEYAVVDMLSANYAVSNKVAVMVRLRNFSTSINMTAVYNIFPKKCTRADNRITANWYSGNGGLVLDTDTKFLTKSIADLFFFTINNKSYTDCPDKSCAVITSEDENYIVNIYPPGAPGIKYGGGGAFLYVKYRKNQISVRKRTQNDVYFYMQVPLISCTNVAAGMYDIATIIKPAVPNEQEEG